MRSRYSRAHDDSKVIALILSGSWRQNPPPVEIAYEQLAQVTPALLKTGAAALAWQRVHNSDLRDSPAGLELREAHRLHALQAVVHESDLIQVVSYLRAHDIDPVLVKGWASARMYTDPGLRPYGDIDLCIRSDQFASAKALLNDSNVAPGSRVDVHKGFEKFGKASWDQLYSRSQSQNIEGVPVRILAPEDHLHLLCFHFLREGGWRALWLVDIAALVENLPPNFDWNVCLGTARNSRNWVGCTLGLARTLLQANTDNVAPEAIAKKLPSWLISAVLKQWERRSTYERHKFPIGRVWRNPHQYFAGARHHWPSPIEATIAMRAPLNELPRLPLQIAVTVRRSLSLLLRGTGRSS